MANDFAIARGINNYTVFFDTAAYSYEVSLAIRVKFLFENTGPCTLAYAFADRKLAAKTLLDDNGAVLTAGAIAANGIYAVVYDGENFRVSIAQGGTQFIGSVTDTDTIDLQVVGDALMANVRHQDTAEIELDEDFGGLKAQLLPTAITPGTYGDSTNVPQVTFDSKGRATSALNVPIAFPAAFITSIANTNTIDLSVLAGQLTADLRYQDSAEIDLSDDASGLKAELKTTTVTPGTYGNSTNVGSFTVDSKGRLTGASNTPIAFPADFISSVLDTNSIDLTAAAGVLSADLRIQNTTEITLAIDASGLKADINTASVVYSKIQNVTANRLLGRNPAGAGPIEEITLGTNLSLTGTTLNAATGVAGSGTLNFVAKWTPDGTTLGNSQIFDSGSFVGIGVATASGSELVRILGNSRLEGTNILDTGGNGTWRASGNVDSLAVNTRQLLSANGIISMEYGNRVARDSSNIVSINWQTRTLAVNAGANSVDWFNRRLQGAWTAQGLSPQTNNTYDLGNNVTPLRWKVIYGLRLDIVGDVATDPMTVSSNTVANAFVVKSAGNIGVNTGTPAASALLDLTSTTGALLVPRMNTAQETALTAVNGMIIYNSQTNKFRGYENGTWVNLV